MERIEVRYSRVLGFGYYHKSILYHRADGVIVVSNAGPSHGASPRFDGWGSLQSWEEYLKTPAEIADFDRKYPNVHTEVILRAENLSPVFDRIMDAGEEINSRARRYDPNRRNSNSAADQKLREAGAPSPQRDGSGKYRSPGSDRLISPAPPPPKDAPLSDGPSASPIGGDRSQEMPTNGGRANSGAGQLRGGNQDATFDRMAEIKTLMRDRHSEYWQGPKADTLQQEYRDFVEASEKDEAFGGSIVLSPEAASTLIGSSINAGAPPASDDGALIHRMAELQTLMADRDSEYWSGSKSEALQQEYRDLIEMQDRRKRRDEDVSLSTMGH
jgi:hypothetical protein